jgi:hypothetical protein
MDDTLIRLISNGAVEHRGDEYPIPNAAAF